MLHHPPFIYLFPYLFLDFSWPQAWLQSIGADASGLVIQAASGQRPTPRAWQLFEEDGRRTQV